MSSRFDQFSPLLFMGVMVTGVALAAYYVWGIFNPTSDFTAEDAPAVGRYKDWVRKNDMPLVGGKIKPEELPAVYCKIIEFDLKNDDRKSARTFIRETIQKKLDDKVLASARLPEAKDLIGKMQTSHRKVERLKAFIAAVQKQVVEKPKGTPDDHLPTLAASVCELPFDPSACPEQAEEMTRLCQATLSPIKEPNDAIRKVIREIEKNCQPPKAAR
jgi:hypothetical protein